MSNIVTDQHTKMAVAEPETGINKRFQVNKWIRLALSILLVMLGAAITYASGLDWKTIVGPDKAGLAVVIISLIKTIYESFAPAAGVQVAPTTGTKIITHEALK